ncbi:MAG TPA: hypothetical protein VLD67_03050, partial [Vicinamibacterales bacterium]|nr:hypothetical protein [Vicinamibacterales bacterium]
MRSFAAHVVAIGVAIATLTAAAQQPQPGAGTDVYHVHFTKAAPGQAAALGKVLMTPDKTAPMPDHFLLLRHQEGDDWDYAVIQHLGQKAAIDAAPGPPGPARNLRAWHNDTFASGPSWSEFTREMGIGGKANTANLVYVLGVFRPVPGHGDQLQKILDQPLPPDAKVQSGGVLLQHLEGGAWQFLTLTRYDSWQDLAADRT